MATRQYSGSQLKAIGEICSNGVPPASAVQAMFLYQMQCQTETERLFHGEMFELASLKQRISAQDPVIADLIKQVTALSEQVKALQSQLARKDADERVAPSKVRIDALNSKVNQHSQQLGEHSEQLVGLRTKMTELDSEKDASQKITVYTPDLQNPGSNEDIKADLSDLNEDITVLFEERDALGKLLNEANARTEEVEKQTHCSVERVENANKNMKEEVKKVENEANEKISKVEQQATELATKVENLANNAIGQARRYADGLMQNLKNLAFERIAKFEVWSMDQISLLNQQASRFSKVEQKLDVLDQQVHNQVEHIKQETEQRINEVEKQAETRIANAEQQMKGRINQAEQQIAKVVREATQQAAKTTQDALDHSAAGHKTLTNEIRALKMESKEHTTTVVNQATEQLEKIGDRTFELKFQFQSETKELKERISKLEDLVRALTAQSPNSISPTSQLLPVQTPNGESLNLSVQKGHSFVSQKENIRSFTPGKQWMN